MSDVNRASWPIDLLAYRSPAYKAHALDRLRGYYETMWERASSRLTIALSFDSMDFELARTVYEADLRRLERLIGKQIERERLRGKKINAELDIRRTELVGDLAPRFIFNHRPSKSYGDDYIPPTGHLAIARASILDLRQSTSQLSGISRMMGTLSTSRATAHRLIGTKTERKLLVLFTGEFQARSRHAFLVSAATDEGPTLCPTTYSRTEFWVWTMFSDAAED
jgi:hypothetical protein